LVECYFCMASPIFREYTTLSLCPLSIRLFLISVAKLYIVICMLLCIIYIQIVPNVGKVHGLFGDMLIEYWDNHH
jgi:hypothetical protein